MLDIRLFGQFSVQIDGRPIELPSRPAQSLLAYLVLNAGKVNRREKLAGLIWQDTTEENSRRYLRTALWRIRKSLGQDRESGEDYILADKISVTFNDKTNFSVDAGTLARDYQGEPCPEDLIDDLSLFGGELLPGFYDDWVVLEREVLNVSFERKIQRLLDCLVQEKRWTEILEWGERWIALGHVPEPAYRALMLAYGALGDISGVVAVYQRCIKSLMGELGVEPSEQTRELYDWLITGGQPEIPQKLQHPVSAVKEHPEEIEKISVGTFLNQRYRLEAERGQGGMGVVYQGYDTLLGRDVAIKVLSSALVDTEAYQRLLQEAQAIAKMNHPNIVSIFDAGEAFGMPYIVMELLEGKTLLESKPDTIEGAIDVIFQVCKALSPVHAAGIVHRDLKPENVMITPDGVVKLMDFGLARLEASRLTKEGEIIGTIYYLAPEQVLGKEVNFRADLYSIGVVLYELVTGHLPFTADDPVAVISQHLHASVIPPVEYNLEIPPELDDLILRLMRKKPEDRPSSVGKVIEVLEYLQIKTAPGQYQKSLVDETEVSTTAVVVKDYDKLFVKPDERVDEIVRADQRELKRTKTAVHALMQRWRERGVDVLDVASLAIIHSSPRDLSFDYEDTVLLIRSALHKEVDVEPWLERAGTQDRAVAALGEIYAEYPNARVRMKIVEALSSQEDARASEVLVKVALSDDAPAVRSEAAVIVARRGRRDEVVQQLVVKINSDEDIAAMTAFVAVWDEVGLPEDAGPYPKFQATVLLIQRRLRAYWSSVFRQGIRAGFGAGLAMALNGLASPIYAAIAFPEDYGGTLELVTVPTWSLMAAVGLMIIGGVQGFAVGLFVGLADMYWRSKSRKIMRVVAGSLAGLVYAGLLILFISMDIEKPPSNPMVYNLTFIVYGLLLGAILTIAVPRLGTVSLLKQRLLRGLQTAALAVVITVPFVYFVYQDYWLSMLISRIMIAIALPMGIALALKGPNPRD
jgi:serine/threonine protein kinase/DNA-binding SARP family transcriptional activator